VLGPGVGDDDVEVPALRLPAEQLTGPIGGRDERGRIARAPLGVGCGDGVPRHASGGLDHLPDAETGAVAEVARQPVVDVERLQRQHVGVGEVGDVDVVADRRAVRCGVVGAEHRDRVAATGGDLQDQRDEVGLGVVTFATPRGGAGGVEVAERRRPEPVDPVVPVEHPLDEQLRLPVRVGRGERGILADGAALGFAVHRGGRGEDEPADAVREQDLEEPRRAGGVDREEPLRGAHGLAGLDQRREVDAGVDALRHHGLDHRAVGDVAPDEAGIRRDRVTVPGGEVVQHHDLVPGPEERGAGRRADEPGTARHQHPHHRNLRRFRTLALSFAELPMSVESGSGVGRAELPSARSGEPDR
jgi:hypothetical protein